jgi:hypothetical protein
VHQLIDLDLLSVEQRLAVRHGKDFSTLNTGFVLADVSGAHGSDP